MIFHENRPLTDDSHEISYFIFFRNLGKMSLNLLFAAVVIDALRVNLRTAVSDVVIICHIDIKYQFLLLCLKCSCFDCLVVFWLKQVKLS